MERVFQVRLKKVDYQDLHQFFDFVRNYIPERFDKYYVRIELTTEDPYKIWYEAAEFDVHDLNHNLLGVFKIKNLSSVTIISFYMKDNNYRQAFVEYIQSTIEEMKLVGFIILDTQGFCEDAINVENDEKTYLPKTGDTRNGWIEVYNCITDYLDELSESDDDEIFVPKLEDYRSRIISKMNKQLSTKTISRIKKAGDEGLLNK